MTSSLLKVPQAPNPQSIICSLWQHKQAETRLTSLVSLAAVSNVNELYSSFIYCPLCGTDKSPFLIKHKLKMKHSEAPSSFVGTLLLTLLFLTTSLFVLLWLSGWGLTRLQEGGGQDEGVLDLQNKTVTRAEVLTNKRVNTEASTGLFVTCTVKCVFVDAPVQIK